MALDDVGLLFRFKADSAQAIGETKALRDELGRFVKQTKAEAQEAQTALTKVGSAFGLNSDRVAGFKAALGTAVPILGAATTAAVGAGTALFAFAKNASDAGSEIFDLKAKTGLGAESLSALKFAADQSGASIQEAAQAFVIYQNKLTDAAAKGKDLFGIDARKALADQEYALRALVEVVNGPLPAGFSRSSLAAELMGRSGSNLIATFDTLGGSFDQFLAQAKRMGVVLTEEDVRAADEFGDSLTVLETQFSALANKMALQYAPQMTGAMKAAGDGISENKDLIVTAGQIIGHTIAGLTEQYRQWAFQIRLIKALGLGLSVEQAATAAGAAGLPGGTPAPGDPSVVTTAGATAVRSGTQVIDFGNAVRVNPDTFRAPRTTEEIERERQKAAQIAEQARAASRSASATAAETAFQKALADAERLFRETGNYIEFVGAVKQAEADRWKARQTQFDEERASVRASTADDAVKAAQIKAKNQEQLSAERQFTQRMAELDRETSERSLAELQRRHRNELELFDLRTREILARQKQLADAGQTSFESAQEAIQKRTAEGFRQRYDFLIAEQKAAKGDAEALADIEQRLKVLNEEAGQFNRAKGVEATAATLQDLNRLIDRAEAAIGRIQNLTPATPGFDPNFKIPQAPGPGGKPQTGPWVDPSTLPPPPNLQPHMDAIGIYKDFATGAFESVTAGFGQMMQGFLLGEKLSGKAFLSMAKSAIAAMAVEAGVRALFELAKGLASLWFNPAEAATHFAAAKTFAVVAALGAGAALAIPGGGGGQAAAGNEFSSGGFNSRGTEERDRTIRDPRFGGAPDPIQPLNVQVHIVAKTDPSVTVEHMKTDYSRGGEFRALLRRDLLGEATG